MTRSQKCYGGALAIGLAALGMDQFIGSSGPAAADASAAAAISAADAAPATQAHSPADPATLAFDGQIAARLQSLRGISSDTRDGFTPSSRWVIGPVAAPSATAEQAIAFQKAHSLKAVTHGGGQAYALVDSSLIAVGQAYDGFVLVSAGDLQATFRCGDITATLAIAR